MPGSSRWNEFCERGGLWVAAQFALMAGIALAWLLPPEWPDTARLPLAVVGIVLVGIGLGLVLWAHGALGPAALAVLWRGKSAIEERMLVARFPEYDAYRDRTPRRFLPGIY
jgi:protein-S-isoprenylcysteine O-methyltransferase Ste14